LIEVNNIYHMDCLEGMDLMIEQSIKVDAIITDPPYGTTQCKWDEVIPLNDMWYRVRQVRKDRTPIILFGNEPFSSRVRNSNIKEYKYDWKWDKVRGVGHFNAKKRPMMCIEDVMVFYKKQPIYNPQMRERNKPRLSKNNATQEVYGESQENFVGEILDKKYPINLISFSKSNQKDFMLHPTQKPVDLIEYLVRTYTNEGGLVLDFTIGSGTTAIACINTNRRYIGFELDDNYYKLAKNRVNQHIMDNNLQDIYPLIA